MRFELEPENHGQSDEMLLGDLRRVAEAVKPAKITKERYNMLGRWCAATMQKRFGSWNKALALAGLTPTHQVYISMSEVIADIQRVATTLGRDAVSFTEYRQNGGMSGGPIRRVFGGWSAAARAAGIQPVRDRVDVTDEICFEAIETVWRKKGRQPRRDELQPPTARVSGDTVTRRFGSWRRALEAFVAYMNTPEDHASQDTHVLGAGPDAPPPLPKTVGRAKSTPRAPGWRLRFLVMHRDGFRCTRCGRSPATHIGVSLVIDHHVPWAQGGQTTFENLRTLCEECNGGKSDLAV